MNEDELKAFISNICCTIAYLPEQGMIHNPNIEVQLDFATKITQVADLALNDIYELKDIKHLIEEISIYG